ncbi:MAG: rhomboid family intramembrane serine protease [Gemmatimonadota bacterium]|jgi:membrane associated rhomboid family serine protease
MYREQTFGLNLRPTPVVKKLLIANVVVFLATSVFQDLEGWLAFRPDRLLTQFWGVFTYMFVHGNLGHLLINMLVLFFFGPPLEGRWGGKEFFRFWLVAGLGGVVLQFAFGGAGSMMIGASAACYGIMLAFAMNWPDAPIYIWGIFPIKAKWLVGFMALMTLMSSFGSQADGVAHFAHLGGLVAALIYLKADWRPGQLARDVKERSRPRTRRLAIVPREDLEKRAVGRDRSLSDREERKMLDEVDRVLDKISEQGMSSLTPEERKLLDDVSRQRRSN